MNIYEKVAEKYHVSPKTVKREMEIAINDMYKKRLIIKNKEIRKFLKKGKPTVEEFLDFTTQHIINQMYS